MDVAVSNHDAKGKKNYVVPFLHSLKIQLRMVEDKISHDQINALAKSSPSLSTLLKSIQTTQIHLLWEGSPSV